jgi:hypothetical protein
MNKFRLNTTLIKEVINIHKDNLCKGHFKLANKDNKAFLLEALRPIGVLGYLSNLRRFLEQHFAEDSLAKQEGEIRQISYEIYAKVLNFSCINHNINKVLHENLDKGYIVKQDGFKVLIYTINIINKDEKCYQVNKEC